MDVPQEVKETRKTKQKKHPACLPAMDELSITAVEEIIGYKFHQTSLLEVAMRPMTNRVSSYFSKNQKTSYGKLKLVGDSSLICGAVVYMYYNYQDVSGKTLRRLSAANINNEKLARIAVEHGLHRYIRHKAPQLEGQIHEFVEDMKNYPLHSNGLLNPPKVFSDIVKSLLGAVYVDANRCHETVWKIFTRLSQPFITIETLGNHPRIELDKLCRQLHQKLEFDDKNWTQNHTVDVLVDGKVIGSATYGQKKKTCRNRAAKVALDRLKLLLN